MRRPTVALLFRALSIVFTALLVHAAAWAASDAEDDHVLREVFVVFNPLNNPPNAADIVDPSSKDELVLKYRQILGQYEAAFLVYPEPLVSPETLQEISTKNPFAPEALAAQVMLVRYPPKTDIQLQLKQLLDDSRVLDATANFHLDTSVSPVDPFFGVNIAGNPNGFPVTPSSFVQGKYQWGLSYLRFPAAWDRIWGDAFVADINTGIYFSGGLAHSDLRANFRPQFSSYLYSPNQPGEVVSHDPDVDESHGGTYVGHGTHVAGIIAATPNNSLGVSGGCWTCSFVEIGFRGDAATVGEGIMSASRRGAQVINLSFGVDPDPIAGGGEYKGPTYCSAHPSVPPCDAIAIAAAREVVLVASSGNDKYHVQFPANQPGVIAVGGLEYTSPGVAQFWTNGYGTPTGTDCTTSTSPGSENGSNCGPEQFVVAPARDVLSTFYPGGSWNPGVFCEDRADPILQSQSGWSNYLTSGYGTCTGTSMSAPFVSALAGLMRSANPTSSVADVRRVIQRRSSGGDVLDPTYRLGYGYPYADDAVIATLSGANSSNPAAFDSSVKNRLTPLFGFYEPTVRNNFYTIFPQMAVAAANGTLLPSPQYSLTTTSWTIPCLYPCNYASLPVSPAPTVLNPNGTNAGSGKPVTFLISGGLEYWGRTRATYSSNASGVATPSFYSDPSYAAKTYYVSATPDGNYSVYYTSTGVPVAGMSSFPGSGATITPRSSFLVYVAHVNPIGGTNLVPLYRLSWRCGYSAQPICSSNPYHVSHVYATSTSDVNSYVASGYKLDGIEGYIFPKSYATAPQTNMVKVCVHSDPGSGETILWPGSENGGATCNRPFPSWSTASYSNYVGWLGWAFQNTNGYAVPTISFTAPANNSSFAAPATVGFTVSTTGTTNVKYYVDGVLKATKTSSPFSWNWSVTAADAGTHEVFAVATNTTSGQSVSSKPRNVTVTTPVTLPSVSNASFESPVVGAGNYQFAPGGGSWTFVPVWAGGGSGISGNGSAFTSANPNAPAGNQVGFIQGPNTISQAITFPSTGSFRISVSAAQRSSNGSYLTVYVKVDGTTRLTLNNSNVGTSYASVTSGSFNVTTTGSHTLTFEGYNPSGLDNTMFLDSVSFSSP